MSRSQFPMLNRDLSWLSFNERVLQEAADPLVPLFNRFLFLSIYSSNLDEFFRVRMPAINAFTGLHTKKISLEEDYPAGLVEAVHDVAGRQLELFGRILREELLPALQKHNIHLCYDEVLEPELSGLRKEYFLTELLPYLQPVYMQLNRKERFFPENNALYFIIQFAPAKKGKGSSFALLNIPAGQVPRFREWPAVNGVRQLSFLDDVIREQLPLLFPQRRIEGAWSVKLTRNADMQLEDEFSGDIAEKIERQLEKRDLGEATRLLVDQQMPAPARDFLVAYFGLGHHQPVSGGRYHNLKDFSKLPIADSAGLVQEEWPAVMHPCFTTSLSVFDSIRKNDQLLHLPYHSYAPVLRFFNEASVDTQVKEIFITLYRVAADSHIAQSLMNAAINGKKVTVFVELKARFDEANNLKWAKKMKAAGVRIINSIPRLKVHAKTALLVREEKGKEVTYACIGTGNFNETTARFYTDHCFFTANPQTGKELGLLFTYLQSRTQPRDYGAIPFQHLFVSRFNMISGFEELISREIEQAQKGKPASIIIKLNNLQEKNMISRLYEAGMAGVRIQLLIRGICCLAPGVKGLSENITVTRLVDRYLEHARVFIFHNGGDTLCYLGSADWMKRNLRNRIEVCIPVKEERLKQELQSIIAIQLADNTKAVRLTGLLENQRVQTEAPAVQAQAGIYLFVKQLEKKQPAS